MLADRPHGRRLSAAERRRLAELERQLRAEDPTLADALDADRPVDPPPRRRVVAGTAATAAVLVLVATLAGVVVGAPLILLSTVLTLITALTLWLLVRAYRSHHGPAPR
jgi:Flp pilus assembly protein TadB